MCIRVPCHEVEYELTMGKGWWMKILRCTFRLSYLGNLGPGRPSPPPNPPVSMFHHQFHQALLDSIGLGAAGFPTDKRAEVRTQISPIDSWLFFLEREWQHVVPVCNICIIHLVILYAQRYVDFNLRLDVFTLWSFEVWFRVFLSFWPGFWMILGQGFQEDLLPHRRWDWDEGDLMDLEMI